MNLASRLAAALVLISVAGCCCVVGGSTTIRAPTPAGTGSAENGRPASPEPDARAQTPGAPAAEKR